MADWVGFLSMPEQLPSPIKDPARRIRKGGPKKLAVTPEELEEYLALPFKERQGWTKRELNRRARAKGQKLPCSPQASERKAEKQEKVKGALARARTANEMQGELAALMKEFGYNPLRELFQVLTSGDLPPKEAVALNKFLVPYITPTLKAIDVQQETKMNVSVSINSYRGANMDDMKAAVKVHSASEYAEFAEIGEAEDDDGLLEDPTNGEDIPN